MSWKLATSHAALLAQNLGQGRRGWLENDPVTVGGSVEGVSIRPMTIDDGVVFVGDRSRGQMVG